MQRVLVTGAAGFIGFHLAKALLQEENVSLVLIDDLSRGNIDTEFEQVLENANVKFYNIDLSSQEACKNIPRDVDTVFHFAAIVGVENVTKQPYTVLSLNVHLLDNVLQYAKTLPHLNRLVFTSTSEIYAGTLLHQGLEFPTPETTPLTLPDLSAPRTSYMLSKIYGEAMCLHSGLPITIVRPHNIYGPRMGHSHVIPQLLAKADRASDGGSLEVYSPDHKRTFCYIDDAVQIMIQAARSSEAVGQTLNLGSERPEVTMRELGEMICQIVGKRLSIDELPPTAGSPERRVPDNSLAGKVTGLRPNVDLLEGITMTYKWYKNTCLS